MFGVGDSREFKSHSADPLPPAQQESNGDGPLREPPLGFINWKGPEVGGSNEMNGNHAALPAPFPPPPATSPAEVINAEEHQNSSPFVQPDTGFSYFNSAEAISVEDNGNAPGVTYVALASPVLRPIKTIDVQVAEVLLRMHESVTTDPIEVYDLNAGNDLSDGNDLDEANDLEEEIDLNERCDHEEKGDLNEESDADEENKVEEESDIADDEDNSSSLHEMTSAQRSEYADLEEDNNSYSTYHQTDSPLLPSVESDDELDLLDAEYTWRPAMVPELTPFHPAWNSVPPSMPGRTPTPTAWRPVQSMPPEEAPTTAVWRGMSGFPPSPSVVSIDSAVNANFCPTCHGAVRTRYDLTVNKTPKLWGDYVVDQWCENCNNVVANN